MSYRCGMDAKLARLVGVEPGGPWVKCDTCGFKVDPMTRHGIAKRWFLNDKPVPGWTMVKHDNGTRTDTCGRCRHHPTPKERGE